MGGRYARVIATSGDSVLLVQEPDYFDHSVITWSIPSGGVEEGETFAEGAARELWEEAGLAVDPSDLIEVARVEVRLADGRASDSVNYAIEVERHEAKVLDPDEFVIQAAWVPLAEAIELMSAHTHLPMWEPGVHYLRERTCTLWRYVDTAMPGTMTPT